MDSRSLRVIKIGGSVLTGRQAYRRVATSLAARLCARPGEQLLVVVSAENGATDALLAKARDITSEPDPSTMDLLWSTGETQSAALLALHLHAQGVSAIAANIHQTGLVQISARESSNRSHVRALRLRALLGAYDVVVAPGFLARGPADRIVSLGRGGSDLSAVLLAAGLRASTCELVKDVPGYFTSDPKRDPEARPVERLSYANAIEMADAGCALVQRNALIAARDSGIPLVISALGAQIATVVSSAS
jgi:aspartate kinase